MDAFSLALVYGMQGMTQKQKTLRMVEMAMLIALVVVLQMLGSFIKIGPLPMSFVLVPIVIGACLLGTASGAVLGGVFGIVNGALSLCAGAFILEFIISAGIFPEYFSEEIIGKTHLFRWIYFAVCGNNILM